MGKLIRLGSVLVNPDHVVAVERHGAETYVFTATSASIVAGLRPGEIRLLGEEGESAWKWFTSQPADVAAETSATLRKSRSTPGGDFRPRMQE